MMNGNDDNDDGIDDKDDDSDEMMGLTLGSSDRSHIPNYRNSNNHSV